MRSDLDEAIRDLIRVGLDNIKGWCPASEVGVMPGLATIDEVDVDEAVSALVESHQVKVLDVRRQTEFAGGHLPGAVNVAHTRLAGRMDEVPEGGRLLVNCRSGARSARASAYLKRAGYDVVNLKGGMLAWEKSTASVEN
jgi:hydroxyacylglutathione hydrolase